MCECCFSDKEAGVLFIQQHLSNLQKAGSCGAVSFILSVYSAINTVCLCRPAGSVNLNCGETEAPAVSPST